MCQQKARDNAAGIPVTHFTLPPRIASNDIMKRRRQARIFPAELVLLLPAARVALARHVTDAAHVGIDS